MSRRDQPWSAAAAALLGEAAVIARDSWANGRIVFACRAGAFAGYNGFQGSLEPFLVERLGIQRFSVYTPSSADLSATDWVLLPADHLIAAMPTEQRSPSSCGFSEQLPLFDR